jgi:uncharacterized protein YndB with AHSA1/START domain
MKRALPLLALAALAAGPASAQRDPWAARLRSFSDAPIATLQGVDCVSIDAPRSIVWRLLVGPETTATWMLAGVPNVVPRRARYAKGLTASKGDVLSLEVTTIEGPRRIDLTVTVLRPGEILSFLMKSDAAELLDSRVEQLMLSFFVEGRPDGTTDVTWVTHYDSDSPIAALLSPADAPHRRTRRVAALNLFKVIAEEAARLPYPPLHDVPTSPQPEPSRRKK